MVHGFGFAAMKTRIHLRSFTLLELLVAMAITLLIAGLMLVVSTQLLGLWQRQQSGHVQAVAAELVLDLLERDLQSAVFRRDGQVWLAADINNSPAGLVNHGWLFTPLMKPASGASLRLLPSVDVNGERDPAFARFGQSGVWLRFVTSNLEAASSLPVVVAYQLARRPVTGDPVAGNPAPVRYGLYRSVVTQAETFTSAYDVTSSNYASANNSPSGALGAAYRAPRNVMNPGHANLLASHVVDFGCWLYQRNPDGTLALIFPRSATDMGYHATGLGAEAGYPEVVDVFIRILSDAGAAQLEALEAGRLTGRPAQYADDDAWWWAVAEANSRVFARRIAIKGTVP